MMSNPSFQTLAQYQSLSDVMNLNLLTNEKADSILCETDVKGPERKDIAMDYGGKIATNDQVSKMIRDDTVGCGGNGLFAGSDFYYRESGKGQFTVDLGGNGQIQKRTS